MENLDLKNTGFGLEQEFFIFNKTQNKIAPMIDGKSSYLVIKDLIQEQLSHLVDFCSPELLSLQIELKSPVFKTTLECADFILDLKSQIESVTKQAGFDIELRSIASTPILDQEVMFADPTSGHSERLNNWLNTREGLMHLKSTATCSTQLCVSQGLENQVADRKWQMLAEVFSYLKSISTEIFEHSNSGRLEIAEKFLQKVKYAQFARLGVFSDPHNYTPEWITRPDGTNMSLWHCGQSGVMDLSETQSKNNHSIFAKGKYTTKLQDTQSPSNQGFIPDIICIEHRWADAKIDIQANVEFIESIHNKMMDSIRY